MNVDMKVLEALTIDRDIPLDRLIVAIEIAVKTAYNEMEGAKPFAHAKLDR
ncbi:MAG: transcription termination/antitermination protein NusA, partial [Actinobacteria bacterium]|nr:transcription termination/antitermination protein NusA [Actinomycetota bacterium]